MEIVRINVLNTGFPTILFINKILDKIFIKRGYTKTTPAIAEKENQNPISLINDWFRIRSRINEMHNILGLFGWRFHCEAITAEIIHMEARSTLALSPSIKLYITRNMAIKTAIMIPDLDLPAMT